MEKNCASIWSFTKNHNKMHGERNIKSYSRPVFRKTSLEINLPAGLKFQRVFCCHCLHSWSLEVSLKSVKSARTRGDFFTTYFYMLQLIENRRKVMTLLSVSQVKETLR